MSLPATKGGRRRTYTRPLTDFVLDSRDWYNPYGKLRSLAAAPGVTDRYIRLLSQMQTPVVPRLRRESVHGVCRWFAYIAGAVLVLIHDCGARVLGDLSFLIHSAVPEGKGVSSSAALEVSTMAALAAALDIKLPGRRLAQLCQKVGVPPVPDLDAVECHQGI